MRNKSEGQKFAVEADGSLQDFYTSYDRYASTPSAKQAYDELYSKLSPEEKSFMTA
ncbi:hypothetical protein [Arcticibacter eurypsychrophilus]|uniref:hypothetical protein n=1 Tax=Arcticibacter eurypsychrophilus TaxID=1434752 RepID=UPI001480A31A|nr:hypothetical protein [Arcticibacter eurypsychrophilus]